MSDGTDSTHRVLAEEDLRELEDGTLAGYLESHSRPPAFEGADGHPYTVSVEWEKVGDLRTPYRGFLVFPRWALTGIGVVGHVETPILWEGRTVDEIHEMAGELTLRQVRELLLEASRGSEESPDMKETP